MNFYLEALKNFDFQSLDIGNIGSWPLPLRILIIIVVCISVGYGTWHFDVRNQLQVLDKAGQEEVSLKQTFEAKQRNAANLEALREQLAEMKQSFGDMIRQLPDQTEVAGLIVDISQTGLAAGLEFELFRPNKEKPAEFYAELPISIRVVGSYHQMGEFVSGIAALPRIVTTHNISIKKVGGSDDKAQLVMDATAKTYRALGEEG